MRDQVTYEAGGKNRVSNVPTTMPPIIAEAIGPQKTSLEIGMSASVAVAAVERIGPYDSALSSSAPWPPCRTSWPAPTFISACGV